MTADDLEQFFLLNRSTVVAYGKFPVIYILIHDPCFGHEKFSVGTLCFNSQFPVKSGLPDPFSLPLLFSRFL